MQPLYLSNIAAAIKYDTDALIASKDRSKNLKHQYKTNESIVIGKLKNNLVLILLCDDITKRELLLNKLILRLQRAKVSSIPDRHFDRPTEAHKKSRSKIKRVV